MTISSTTVRNSYSGDNSTTTFSYTFKIFADSDIQVIIRSANGTETTKTITTHYTVTGAGNSGGGSVIFTSGNIPTSTQTVVLRRNIPQTQAIDYIANDPFPAESHEEGLDRATMAIQQLQEELTRSIKLSKTNTMTSTEFSVGASDRANKILAFDTNGELAVTQELGTNRGNWSSGVTFNGRDIVKDSSNNNIYLCNTTHTSTGTTPISSNADVAKWDLIVDAAAASTSANAAANSASNSSNFANTSANHASNSANHASNSSNFANNSSNSANTSATYLAGVSANANAAANSASNASNFANNSSNSANSSANHSSNSSNFANNSSNHASNSSNFANNSSNSANSASASATTATTQAGFASSNAATATTQAGFATSNATAALGYSSNSSNFSNNASNFANTASNAANAANSARDAAITLVDSFEDVYLGAKASDPTLDNDGDALTAGDLYYNTVGNVLKYYTGSAWVAITSGGITDLVQDTTPQLGGALDVNTFSITSTSNGNITLQPNGTGDVVLSADTVKIGDANTDAVLTTDGTGDITISTNSGSNSGTVKIFDGVNGNIEITPNGSGVVKLDGISYPIADGSAGQALVTNGSGVLSFASAGLAWQSVQTTGFTAVKGNAYPCNTTSAGFTVTLPASPSVGDQVLLLDYAGTFDTNNLTINPNSNKLEGGTGNLVLSGDREGVTLTYIDSTQGWLAVSGIQEGTDALAPPTYSIDFLVVAGGGGGGGRYYSGGGGAGGYRTSTQSFTAGVAITVTVGAFGAGGSGQSVQGSTGSNSSISGSGLTTITSAGGGGGGSFNSGPAFNGLSGGSGGGSSGYTNSVASGNTPSTSPSQGNNGGAGTNGAPYGSGGGGGAGAVGQNGPGGTSGGGNGGNGLASSITGSSVTRAGGGGGGASGFTPSPAGSGGTGGGGNGDSKSPDVRGTAGGTNTGGGGGSTDGNPPSVSNGYNGGSGVVILSMPDANYSGTTTGSPTVATGVSGKTVLTFTGSGSYTT
jgi:hypothetical protein